MLIVENVVLTSNPNALKFVVNEILLVRETRNFKMKETAEKDALAKAVFKINGVISVFYCDRFITIEKEADVNWNDVQKEVIKTLYKFNKALIPPEEKFETIVSEKDYKTLYKITKIIDEQVRPTLAGDGGGLDIVKLENNKLKIKYLGACGSCSSSITGTLQAMENLLRREVNSKITVVAV